MIPVYQPHIGENEKKYVLDAVESTWVSSRGEYLDRFESGFAEYVGAQNGIATCNGTVSLHLVLVALGVGPGDEVIVPTLTYVASVNAIAYTGATPVFVDCHPDYWNLDPELIEERITANTKAIMVVHLYGHPADMDPIMEISRTHGIPVIEDAAEAHGAEYRGRRVGCFGLAGSYSFFGNKIITTGEGGMVVTSDAHFAGVCRHLRGQGVSPTRTYWHDVVGFNYRMTNIAAALGCAQLERIQSTISRKREIAKRYEAALGGLRGIVLQTEMPWATSVYWMVSILVENGLRDEMMLHLRSNGVETRPFFYPAHTLPMYDRGEAFPVSERVAAAGVNLPSFPDLTDDEVDSICRLVERFAEDRLS
ncbi:MAG: hypothetical protein CVT67_01735 [Actinobacteria bacterium HGW-Actinobacteria-7]|nr:MAG: hypothetical protein CVT67_01735 [Actinobacteria bacterium HGW-Actinobacteria-7]